MNPKSDKERRKGESGVGGRGTDIGLGRTMLDRERVSSQGLGGDEGGNSCICIPYISHHLRLSQASGWIPFKPRIWFIDPPSPS